MRLVSVIGCGQCSSEEAGWAEIVGRELAGHGLAIVCGGLGGIMEAVCRGAQQAQGLTVGLLPGKDRAAANPYVALALPTGLGEARNALVVAGGEVVIAIGGGHGTLSEIALALKMGKAVIGLGTWKAVRPDGTPADLIEVDSPQEAVARALDILEDSQP